MSGTSPGELINVLLLVCYVMLCCAGLYCSIPHSKPASEQLYQAGRFGCTSSCLLLLQAHKLSEVSTAEVQ
jgi:hypothetical protein